MAFWCAGSIVWTARRSSTSSRNIVPAPCRANLLRITIEADVTRLTIRIDFDSTRQIGHGKVRLLELIDQHGSISSAARAMGMSYRRAWLLTDEVNHMFVEQVIETQLGGKGGGNARLTKLGRQIVELYREIETQSLAKFAERIDTLGGKLSEPMA